MVLRPHRKLAPLNASTPKPENPIGIAWMFPVEPREKEIAEKIDIMTGMESVGALSTRVFKLPELREHVPIHAACFAMLSLTPVMDLDVSS